MLASYTDPFPTSLPYESAISGKVPIRDASVTPAELFKARRERKKIAPDFLGDNDRTLTVTGVSSATEPCRTVTLLQRFPVCPGTVPLPALTGPWLSIDANRHADANRYLTTSLYTAYEENDLGLASHVLGYMSLHAFYRGQGDEAISLASTATALAGSGTPRIRAIVHARAERAHAQFGDSTPCERQLDIAQTSLSTAVPTDKNPEWINYVDEIELAAQRGACFLDLGKRAQEPAGRIRFGRQAADALGEAIDGIKTRASGRMRDLVHYTIRLASAYALQDEPHKSITIAHEAHTLAGYIESARVNERFADLIPLLNNYDMPETREFIERIGR